MTNSRRTTISNHRGGAVCLRQAVVAGALALAVTTAFAPGLARAQDAGDDEPTTIWNFDKKLSDKVLQTLGLKGGDGIDYRERSPLVVPPTRDLPPPQQKSANVQVPPNWPVDPDAKANKPQTPAARKASNSDATWIDFTGNQVGSIGKGAVGPNVGPGKVTDPDAAEAPLKPSDLGYKGNLFSFGNMFKHDDDEEVGTFTGEKPRVTLTEPPIGYQTPSPNQPYGVTKRVERSKAAKPDQAAGDALPK